MRGTLLHMELQHQPQQVDSLPCILNSQPAKIWAGTVPGALKTFGVQVSMCPMVTVPPGLCRRPSPSHSPWGSMVGMELGSALLPPSPASPEPSSVSPC